MSISLIRLNRDKKITQLLKDLKKHISKESSKKHIKHYCKKLSLHLDIPPKILKNEIKILLFKNFENQHGKFKDFFSFKYVLFYSIKFIAITLFIIFFSKKYNKKKKYFDLIIDDIDKFNTTKRFFNLINLVKTKFISTNKNYKEKNFYYFNNYRSISSNILFIKYPWRLVEIFFITLYGSIMSRNNLFPISIEFIKTISKYRTIFNEINSKYIIQERHYNSSELKNYIFKDMGGKFSCVTQKNILQMNGVGMYVHSDVFFSLGKETARHLRKYGGKVSKIVPVGSLAMELNYFNRKKTNNLKKFDLLVFASDHDKVFHSGYNTYYFDYMIHFDWIEKFAKEFPGYKIGIKLKHVIRDKNVINKFKNIKNVKFLLDRKYLSDSYLYAHKAKSLCTWSSTLAFEFLGQGRTVYFCDPNFKNVSFLPNDSYIKKFKIGNYQIFKRKILNQIRYKKFRFFNNTKLQNDFCLKSSNVSQNIYLSLKKLD